MRAILSAVLILSPAQNTGIKIVVVEARTRPPV
jgi:hypothetical protein